jgi:alkylation response protein AidB-like acyl-CoA dehydrogenase
MDIQTIAKNVAELSSRFAAERGERQQRRALDPDDFAELRRAGFPLTGVPVEQGGAWETLPRSARHACDLLRVLAHGDPAVALSPAASSR